MNMKYAIKSINNGTYFRGWSGIGPMFGGTKEEAILFNDKIAAEVERCKHSFAFAMTDIEEV